MERFLRIWGVLVSFLSGEWLLRFRPNGGDIIILRAVLVSTFLFLAFIAIKHGIDPSRTSNFDLDELRKEVVVSVSVFGGMLAATSALFYARFASQWSYLAGLYNQLLAAELRNEAFTPDQMESFAYWKASFIEDAEDLHLATKRAFAPAIRHWLDEEAVRNAYVDGAFGGTQRFLHLCNRLDRALGVKSG